MIDTASRIATTQEKLQTQGLGAILVSNHYNLQYLFSFIGLSREEREGWGLLTTEAAYLFTDSRYINNVKAQILKVKSLNIKLIDYQHKLGDQVRDILEKKRIKKFGFEQDDLTYGEFTKLSKSLNKVELVPVNNFVEDIRAIKDREEIDRLEKACQFTDVILKQTVELIKIGATERYIAQKMERIVRDKGLQLSFDPIIAVDANSAVPHYNTSHQGSTKVKKGSVVLIDMGVKYRGYCADITRMFFVSPVSNEVRNVYDKLLNVQQQTLLRAKHNTKAKDIDEFSRNLLSKILNLSLPHATGHGVGLQIHESPSISPPSDDVLAKGQVFTIEPGVYIAGKYGMRIEDTVMIDENNLPSSLTKFSKTLATL